MAPRRTGALEAATRGGGIADRLATSSSPRPADASAASVEAGTAPLSSLSSGRHSAAWLAEQHPALFRLHSAALSRLPELQQQEGTANAAITDAVETALRDFPPQDSRRLELVRAASYFLNHAGTDSFSKAKEDLSRLAIGS